MSNLLTLLTTWNIELIGQDFFQEAEIIYKIHIKGIDCMYKVAWFFSRNGLFTIKLPIKLQKRWQSMSRTIAKLGDVENLMTWKV